MKDETIFGYRAQLGRGEPLTMDQQRAIVIHAVSMITPTDEAKSVEQQRQRVAEQRNGMTAAIADLRLALGLAASNNTDNGLWINADGWYKANYIAGLMDQFVHQKQKTKDFTTWDDYRVTIDEEFGSTQTTRLE